MPNRERKTVNPVGNREIKEPTPRRESSQDDFARGDFFRDLKKVVKKLPPDHPSRSDSRRR